MSYRQLKEFYRFRGTSSDSFDTERVEKQGCKIRGVDPMSHPYIRSNAADNRAARVFEFAAEFTVSC